jgi:hypothetical protein
LCATIRAVKRLLIAAVIIFTPRLERAEGIAYDSGPDNQRDDLFHDDVVRSRHGQRCLRSMLINSAGVQLDANMPDFRFPPSMRSTP